MTTNDRAAFMVEDFPLTLDDGIVVMVHDDPDGYLSAGESEDVEHTNYLGVTVDDPTTDAHESLWSIGIPDHYSGHECRAELWSHVVGPEFYDLLGSVRRQRALELAERAEWAARDTVTV
jgi:hypothetical protein